MSTINTLYEQKSKMDTKCKDFVYMKYLLAYEDSNTIKPCVCLKTFDRNNAEYCYSI